MDRKRSEAIGKMLKTYRIHTGLQPETIVELIDLESEALLFQYENGSVQVPLSKIYAFANIYEIPGSKLIELFYKISEESQESLMDLEKDFK